MRTEVSTVSVERNPLDGRIDRETISSSTSERFPTRYDLLLVLLPLPLLLVLLPLPLLLGIVVAKLLSLPMAFGVGVGGLPSALLLGYGLFVASPTGTSGTAASAENE